MLLGHISSGIRQQSVRRFQSGLARQLLAAGDRVRVIAESDQLADWPDAVELVEGSITRPSECLTKLRFRVTVNTGNRLMSGTSMTRELALLADAFGYDLPDFRWFAINTMQSAFIPFDERLTIIGNVIKPWYADQLKA